MFLYFVGMITCSNLLLLLARGFFFFKFQNKLFLPLEKYNLFFYGVMERK